MSLLAFTLQTKLPNLPSKTIFYILYTLIILQLFVVYNCHDHDYSGTKRKERSKS
ncbi:hypothetical protein ABIB39_003535 [Mucilaginibacter sp. UYP27]